MIEQKDVQAWRTDEQLIDDTLCRAFRGTPDTDDKFQSLLKKIGEVSGRQEGKH